jgi:hypothetical protein
MGVIGADKSALVTAHILKTIPEIGLKVLHQVADMDIAVGVGESTGHQNFTR